jgi:hypothetical protein
MRNFTKLVMASALLATQATPTDSAVVAAAVQTSVPTVVSAQSQISFQTTSTTPVELKLPAKPDFDTQVLVPLRAKQAADAAAAAKAAADRAAAAKAQQAVKTVIATVTGDPIAWMAAAGVSPSDYGYVDYIVNHESSWAGITTWNHSGSGAYGMFQALPGSKMASAGADWATNPVTQIRWATGYATGRYGSWAGAYNYWLTHHSW